MRSALSIFRRWSKVGSFKPGAMAPRRKEDDMKRTAYMIGALAALLLMAIVPVYAQKMSAQVNIPFGFMVDDVRMPAGEYLIIAPSEKVICIQRVGGPEVKATITNSSGPVKWNGRPKLVFRHYGSLYFVAAAWLPNSDHSHEFFTSATEIEVARNTPQKSYELVMNVTK
jgi:hypothetical protein